MNNDNIKEKIQNKIKYLNDMADKYDKLNQRTNLKYLWRLQGIQGDIEALENLQNDITGEWDDAYKEDLKESME